ncbi:PLASMODESMATA CALLOSE-BINDING PROTEIN 3-like [Benincasa hispida]|uniref:PLASMODESMATA CALLOSE-BINDING PROTEIN 3-like n=1 Tax=Benincasa hispida TaxID=102211 RepID=UPI0018FF1A6E|nr:PLASMODESMATA CALLOSE-BINDING PROTEIN 3-like [Benincasa hispida]
MGTCIHLHFALLSFLVFLSLGSSIAQRPFFEANQEDSVLQNQEEQIPYFSTSTSSNQLDTIPIVNPTTPGGTTPTQTPIVNPPSPPAQTIPTGPIITPTTPTTTGGGSWCIASPNASPTALQVALDYACGYGGADCSAIQSGGSCFEPNTMRDHASYAFNDYYQKNPAPTSCVFGGTAQLTSTDPSNGNCHYAASRSTPSTTTPINPPTNPTPMPPATPTITTPTPTDTMPTDAPPTDTAPTDASGYGSEPSDTASSAIPVTSYFSFVFLGSLLMANCM